MKINQRVVKFCRLLFKHFQMGNVSDSATVLAYYSLLSLFPILLILSSVGRMIKGTPDAILRYLKPIIPADVFNTLTPLIHSVFEVKHYSGSLLIGIIIVIWSASQAVAAFQRTINRTYGIDHEQNFIMNHLVSFAIMVLLVFLLVVLMLFEGFSQVFLMWLAPLFHLTKGEIGLFGILKIPLVLMLGFGLAILLYYLVPSVKTKLKFVWVGSLCSVIGLTGLSQIFSLILRYFFSSISLYKTLGTFIVIMLWLYFIGIILLFGGVVNASVQEMVTGEIRYNHFRMKSLMGKAKKLKQNKKNTD